MKKKRLFQVAAVLGASGLAYSFYQYRQELKCERPGFEILQRYDGFEVRRYESYTVAETVVGGTEMKDVVYSGFRTLAGFIFGENERSEKIAMTAPVDYRPSESKVTFMMPTSEVERGLPKPNEEKIVLTEVPAGVFAARPFKGRMSQKRLEQERRALLSNVEKEGLKAAGEVVVGQFNSPFILPFLRENEVRVELVDYR